MMNLGNLGEIGGGNRLGTTGRRNCRTKTIGMASRTPLKDFTGGPRDVGVVSAEPRTTENQRGNGGI